MVSDNVIIAIITTLPVTIAAIGAFYISYRTLQQAKGIHADTGVNLAATKQDLENAKTRISDIQLFVENATPADVRLPNELLAHIPATQVEVK